LGRVTAAGFELSFAQWLAMNLRREESGFGLGIELPAIRSLLTSYLEEDLWPVLERLAPGTRVDLLLGGRSGVLDPASRARLGSLAAARPNIHIETLLNAGHWVHVDDPDGVLRWAHSALLTGTASRG
jgi:pimeloyl-ACP methyl ester carboxylesterase